jgi:hypothetical protein
VDVIVPQWHWGGEAQVTNGPESEHGILIDDNDIVWLAGARSK